MPSTITITLGPITLPAFVGKLDVGGVSVDVPIPAGVVIPAGVTGTFEMPALAVTIDSGTTTIDSTGTTL